MRIEQAVQRALSVRNFTKAHALLAQLPPEPAGSARYAFLATMFSAHLSSSNYPECFVRFMEIARLKTADPQTRLQSCVEASSVALALLDPGRMDQVVGLMTTLESKYRSWMSVGLWRGLIRLNRAHLVARSGASSALWLYQAAAEYLREEDGYERQQVEAFARLAVQLERAGQPHAADKAISQAVEALRSSQNRQEVLMARGLIALARGAIGEAADYGREATSAAAAAQDFPVLVQSHRLLAAAAVAAGHTGEAQWHSLQAQQFALNRRLYYLLGSGPAEATQARPYMEPLEGAS